VSVLGKRVADLTESDKKKISKPLGTSQRPYPMPFEAYVQDDRGRTTQIRKLGAIKSDTDPMMVYSDRTYGEVMGMLLRDMPTPSMLPLFADELNQRKPGTKRVLLYKEGAPGVGKTFGTELIAKVRDKRGAIKIDCGKKNLGDLLFEPVLDFGKDRRFYDEFDRRVEAYNEAKTDEQRARVFHPHSITMLRSSLGESFSEEGGRIAIDWAKTHQCLKDKDGNYIEARETVSIVSNALIDVAKNEGFGHMAGNALGMATQEGPLIRAWKEGRELLLDEFNRGKEGTTASLHTVLQFLAGEIDQVTVENTLKEKGEDVGQTFTFRREDQRAGFFVTMTGNSEEDGSDVGELATSLSSRIVPRFIPVATVEDWQHRICQIMTGLPVSTLYRASEADWRKNPDAFRQKLIEWRTLGLSKDEAANVPELQLKLLRRWEDVLEASEKLARFYYGWSQVVNPESPAHRAGSLSQLMEEIDERYSSKLSVDFRKVILHIGEALEKRPAAQAAEQAQGVDFGDWSREPDIKAETVEEDPALHFGTRLAKVIMGHINATTIEIGKFNLHRQLMQHAADCGLTDPALQEGKPSTRRSISALLDDNPYASDVPDIKAELVRDLLCDYLRQIDPQLSTNNGDIMSVRTVREVMDTLASDDEAPVVDVGDENKAEDENEPARTLTVFNDDLDTIQSRPLEQAVTYDSVPSATDGEPETPVADELLSQTSFLYSLASPALRKGNLVAIWNRALSRSGLVEATAETGVGDSLAMAENRSKAGLAITTVMVSNDNGKGKAQTVPLHVVWNSAADKLLVVGEGKLPAKIGLAFANSRVTYIDRSEEGAARKAGAALFGIAGGDAKVADRLKTAFLMRNMLDAVDEQDKTGLEDLLVRRDVKCFLPHYIVKPAPRNAIG
jgi:hypothetical protein